MTIETLERPAPTAGIRRTHAPCAASPVAYPAPAVGAPTPTTLPLGGGIVLSESPTPDAALLPLDFDLDAALPGIATPAPEFIADRDLLGERIMQSATAPRREAFAVKCRSVSHATDFATPMRSSLMTLSSAFGGVSATIAPSLQLHTWAAMEMLVSSLERAGAGSLWQPISERSIGVGNAKHIFVSVDNPRRDEATPLRPNLLVEVVGAHLIDPDWFDRVVEPRCRDSALTFVYYGQQGFDGSLFEHAWQEADVHGRV